jgi:hypothetical protein
VSWASAPLRTVHPPGIPGAFFLSEGDLVSGGALGSRNPIGRRESLSCSLTAGAPLAGAMSPSIPRTASRIALPIAEMESGSMAILKLESDALSFENAATSRDSAVSLRAPEVAPPFREALRSSCSILVLAASAPVRETLTLASRSSASPSSFACRSSTLVASGSTLKVTTRPPTFSSPATAAPFQLCLRLVALKGFPLLPLHEHVVRGVLAVFGQRKGQDACRVNREQTSDLKSHEVVVFQAFPSLPSSSSSTALMSLTASASFT